MQAIAPATIAELARLAGVDVQSIRSYEEHGLLPKPRRRRGRSGDPAYHQEHLDRAIFIRRAREFGFSFQAIAELTGTNGGLLTCNDAYRIAERQLADIRRNIAGLQEQEAKLSELVGACPGTGPGSNCVILNTLRRPDAVKSNPCAK
jgi:MerR family mercuric resistance operon transcriptional regulator